MKYKTILLSIGIILFVISLINNPEIENHNLNIPRTIEIDTSIFLTKNSYDSKIDKVELPNGMCIIFITDKSALRTDFDLKIDCGRVNDRNPWESYLALTSLINYQYNNFGSLKKNVLLSGFDLNHDVTLNLSKLSFSTSIDSSYKFADHLLEIFTKKKISKLVLEKQKELLIQVSEKDRIKISNKILDILSSSVDTLSELNRPFFANSEIISHVNKSDIEDFIEQNYIPQKISLIIKTNNVKLKAHLINSFSKLKNTPPISPISEKKKTSPKNDTCVFVDEQDLKIIFSHFLPLTNKNLLKTVTFALNQRGNNSLIQYLKDINLIENMNSNCLFMKDSIMLQTIITPTQDGLKNWLDTYKYYKDFLSICISSKHIFRMLNMLNKEEYINFRYANINCINDRHIILSYLDKDVDSITLNDITIEQTHPIILIFAPIKIWNTIEDKMFKPDSPYSTITVSKSGFKGHIVSIPNNITLDLKLPEFILSTSNDYLDNRFHKENIKTQKLPIFNVERLNSSETTKVHFAEDNYFIDGKNSYLVSVYHPWSNSGQNTLETKINSIIHYIEKSLEDEKYFLQSIKSELKIYKDYNGTINFYINCPSKISGHILEKIHNAICNMNESTYETFKEEELSYEDAFSAIIMRNNINSNLLHIELPKITPEDIEAFKSNINIKILCFSSKPKEDVLDTVNKIISISKTPPNTDEIIHVNKKTLSIQQSLETNSKTAIFGINFGSLFEASTYVYREIFKTGIKHILNEFIYENKNGSILEQVSSIDTNNQAWLIISLTSSKVPASTMEDIFNEFIRFFDLNFDDPCIFGEERFNKIKQICKDNIKLIPMDHQEAINTIKILSKYDKEPSLSRILKCLEKEEVQTFKKFILDKMNEGKLQNITLLIK